MSELISFDIPLEESQNIDNFMKVKSKNEDPKAHAFRQKLISRIGDSLFHRLYNFVVSSKKKGIPDKSVF